MLGNNLNTNEIKNSAGAEVEFQHLSQEGRSRVFAMVGESPSLQHRLDISHVESGKGLTLVRRSLVRFTKNVISQVDTVTPVPILGYTVLQVPVGHLTSLAEPTHVLAELMSFCASLGATTTILYDGTGNGAQVLLNGSL